MADIPLAVSAAVLTKNGAGRIERCLESIARSHFADEILVFVDQATTDDTLRIARRFTPQVHLLETSGYIEPLLPRMASLCSGEFILRIDDDECLGGDWSRSRWEAQVYFNSITHFLMPRRWMVPGGRFLASEPWFPDFQLRLFRNHSARIIWPAALHEPMHVSGRGLFLCDRWIEHYDLVLNSRSDRERKARRYQGIRPEKHLSHMYLYEEQNPESLPVDEAGFWAAMRRQLPGWKLQAGTPAAAPYQPGTEIRFGAGGNAAEYRLAGWSAPEPWGTWTEGLRADLRLPLEHPIEGAARLTVEADAYVSPLHPQFRVRVFCGNEWIGEWKIETGAIEQRTLTIPAKVLQQKTELILGFHIMDPASPYDCGQSEDDRRVLGLGFRRLRLDT